MLSLCGFDIHLLMTDSVEGLFINPCVSSGEVSVPLFPILYGFAVFLKYRSLLTVLGLCC